MILVFGATGRAGAEVVRALTAQERPVRAFVRDRSRACELLGLEPELAVGDLADPASVRAALAGVDEVVLSCADDPRRVAWEAEAIDAAAAAGVRRIVKLSSIVAAPGAPVAFWDWHGRVEAHLRASGVRFTVLRAAFYMTNLLAAADAVAASGVLPAPAGSARIAMVDPADVGASVAAVLGDRSQDGATHVLTGPRAVTYAEVAEALGAATKRRVRYVDVEPEAARRALVDDGVPAFAAEQIVAVFAELCRGLGAHPTSAVAELTGRPPGDLTAFLARHANAFAAVPATVTP